jgi:hypothetical protein
MNNYDYDGLFPLKKKGQTINPPNAEQVHQRKQKMILDWHALDLTASNSFLLRGIQFQQYSNLQFLY